MAKLKLKRPGSSLDAVSNTKSGGSTPVYPNYMDAPSEQSANLDALDNKAYLRNRSSNIKPSDTIHYDRGALDGTSYKAVAKKGSDYAKMKDAGMTLPPNLAPGRSTYLTEKDNKNAVKNWVPNGGVSKATPYKKKKK